jgi:N-acetylglucosamine kinase-like BadF-type ATPase
MSGRSGLLVGIDGGGSKTVALLAGRSAVVLGRGIAGPSNYQAIGAEAAGAALTAAVRAAYADAGLPFVPPDAICLGLAGVYRPEDQAFIQTWAATELPGTAVRTVNDAALVLAAGTPDDWGVAIICGTGSIALGRSSEGAAVRAGGWGYLLGDEGSGYAIGVAALRAVVRGYDGRGPATALTGVILAHWGLPDPPALVKRVYRDALARAEIAALAELVDATAAAGDPVAQEILAAAADELALAAAAVVAGLGVAPPIPCALAGGVIIKGEALRSRFLAAVQARGLRLHPITAVVEPAAGAVRLAQQWAEGRV